MTDAAPAPAPTKPSGAFNRETVLAVTHLTDRLFHFTTTRDMSLRFQNGQFTMIGIEVNGKPLLRAYSMVSANWEEVRALMWNFVGIVRSDKRLERARRRVELLREEILEYYWKFRVTRDVLELRNISLVGHLIIECARQRKESRGLHYTIDYPDTRDAFARDTVLDKRSGPRA